MEFNGLHLRAPAEDIGETESTVCRNQSFDNVLEHQEYGPISIQSTIPFGGVNYTLESGVIKADGENAGITAPTAVPTMASAGAGNVDGDVNYAYTYVRIIGTLASPTALYESELSPIGTFTASNNEVNVTVTAPSESWVTHVRVYRSGGSNFIQDFSIVGTIDITGGVPSPLLADDVEDVDLGAIFIADNNLPPETSIEKIYFFNDRLWAVKGEKLFFSKIKQFGAFPDVNFFQFDGQITGISNVTRVLAIATQDGIDIITGRQDFELTRTSTPVVKGCQHLNSFVRAKNVILYIADDGVYEFNGSSSRKISEKVDPLFPLSDSGEIFGNFDGRYYLINTGLGFDIQTGNIFNWSPDSTWDWKSKDFTYDQVLGESSRISIDYTGQPTVELFFDGTRKLVFELKNKTSRRPLKYLRIPSGRYQRFQIRFTGDDTNKVYGWRPIS